MDNFYNMVFLLEELEYARNNLGFFEIVRNNVVAKFNKSFFIKLPREVHIYNSMNTDDINKNKTDHIP